MEIANWLKSKSQRFSRQVSDMGMKFNTTGNENVVLDANGIHTGFGMCNIASAAIEEATINRFGDRVDVNVTSLNTKTCDFAHQVTRIKSKQGDSVTVDGSYRQIDKKSDGLVVVPTEMEDQIYRIRNEINTYGRGEASKKIRKEIQQGLWGKITITDFDALISILTNE